jgi:hypothetical protein
MPPLNLLTGLGELDTPIVAMPPLNLLPGLDQRRRF